MKIVSLAAAAFAAMYMTAAQAIVVTDCCDWSSGWNFSSFAIGAGTASATVEIAGGNPGARLNVTTVTPTPSDTAFATATYQNFVTSIPLSGAAFTLTLDVLSGAGGFGQGQGIELLVEQNGTIYGMSLGITGWPFNSFTTLNFPGTFNAGSFTRVIGAGPLLPVFDGSVPTRFGFAAGNNSSATLTQYYDNFRLDIPSLGVASIAVPTLSSWGLILLAIALAACGITWQQRRARR